MQQSGQRGCLPPSSLSFSLSFADATTYTPTLHSRRCSLEITGCLLGSSQREFERAEDTQPPGCTLVGLRCKGEDGWRNWENFVRATSFQTFPGDTGDVAYCFMYAVRVAYTGFGRSCGNVRVIARFSLLTGCCNEMHFQAWLAAAIALIEIESTISFAYRLFPGAHYLYRYWRKIIPAREPSPRIYAVIAISSDNVGLRVICGRAPWNSIFIPSQTLFPQRLFLFANESVIKQFDLCRCFGV